MLNVLARNQRKSLSAIALALSLSLSACSLTDGLEAASTPSHTSSWVKPDDPQERIGSQEHPLVIAKYGGEYHNREVEKLLAVIVGRLVEVSPDKNRVYKVAILDTPKVNAFALPGGFLYVTRGLLALANDTSELAAVLSHEMAHVTANHAILRRDRQSSSNVGKEVVSEVLGGSVAARVALAANQIRLSDFSKDQELQADAVGIRTLGNAGFDAHGAARFLETMEAYRSLNRSGNGQFGSNVFLSTHPSTPRRIKLAKQHARFFGAPGTGDASKDRYLKGINGMLFGDSSEEGFVRGDRFSHAGLGITFAVPANTEIENESTSVVISGPGTIATRFDAAVIKTRQSLTDYLKSGWVKGLDETSITESQINGLPAASARAHGGDWDFVIQVILIDKQVYRFITAGPIASVDVATTSQAITSSFRQMSDVEKAALRPLRIRIVNVGPSDNLGTLSTRMKTDANKLKLFQTLNGLQSGDRLLPGQKVKIISE